MVCRVCARMEQVKAKNRSEVQAEYRVPYITEHVAKHHGNGALSAKHTKKGAAGRRKRAAGSPEVLSIRKIIGKS